MGCCGCCRPRRMYVRLVNALYSKSTDGDVPAKPLGNLVDYAEEFPKKLVPICALLRKRALADYAQHKTKWVVLAVKAMEALTAECAEHLGLFGADVVAMIEMLLESNMFELQVAGAGAFVTYAANVDGTAPSRHKWSSFVHYFSAMCWKQAATGAALVRPGICGLRAVISHSAILDTELVDLLSSIVPAIVSNISPADSPLPAALLAAHPFVAGEPALPSRRTKARSARRSARKGKAAASGSGSDSFYSSDWSSSGRSGSGSGSDSGSDAAGSSGLALGEIPLALSLDDQMAAVDEAAASDSELAGLALYELGYHAHSTTLRTIVETLLSYFSDTDMWERQSGHIGTIMRILMAAVGVSYRFVPVQSALDYVAIASDSSVKAGVVGLASSLIASSRVPLDTSTALQILNQIVGALPGARGSLKAALLDAIRTLTTALASSVERLELLLFVGSKLSFCAAESTAAPLLDAATTIAATLVSVTPNKVTFLEPLLDALTVASSAASLGNRLRVHAVYAHLLAAAKGSGFVAKYGSRIRYAMYFLLTSSSAVVHPADVAALASTLAALLDASPVAELAASLPMLFKLQEQATMLARPLALSVHALVAAYVRAAGAAVSSAELVDYIDRIREARAGAGELCPYVRIDVADTANGLHVVAASSKYPADVVEEMSQGAGGAPSGGRRKKRRRKGAAREDAGSKSAQIAHLIEKEVVVSCLVTTPALRASAIDLEDVLGSGWSTAHIAKEHESILARRKHKHNLFHKLATMAGMFTSLHKAAKSSGLRADARGGNDDLAASDVELFAEMFSDGAAPPANSLPARVALRQSAQAASTSCAASHGARMSRAAAVLAAIPPPPPDALAVYDDASSELDSTDVARPLSTSTLPSLGPFSPFSLSAPAPAPTARPPLPASVVLVTNDTSNMAMQDASHTFDFSNWRVRSE